jgi:hypothetical protein
VQEKEEEFEGTRRNHAKLMEQMQCAIETESKSKAEAQRMRKKLELDINELESALSHANLANAELQKSVRLYQAPTSVARWPPTPGGADYHRMWVTG